MPKLTSTQIGSSPDYYKYISDQPVKTDRTGDPDLFEFTLVGTDDDFVKLNRGAYITASSDTLKDKNGNPVDWFTGYIAYDPDYEYVGLDSAVGLPAFKLKYQAMSDEYILSQQSLGILAPFINMTQGQILAALANQLLPGMFDTSGIQDGLFLARYVVDPTKNFQDIIKEFSDSAVYRFWGRSKKLFFTPQDASLFVSSVVPVTVDGYDKYFTPDNLKIRSTQQTITNDVIVLGSTEPQEYVTEYFVGDGVSAQFPLMESAFGIESAVLLDDDFSGNQIDNSKWTVYDTPSNYLQTSNGFLNVLGGLNDGHMAVHLDSANLIPIAGNISITHGDFDFIDASQPAGTLGVIGGLWTQSPNDALTGCVYGIKVTRDGAGKTHLTEIINGATTSNTVIADPTKSYVIRTNLTASRINRAPQTYNYFDLNGVVQTITPASPNYNDTVSFGTILSEIDLVTGLLTSGWPVSWHSSLSLASNQDLFANYVLVASENLHLAVTGTTVYTPFQASLDTNAAKDIPTANSTVTLTGTVTSVSTIITGSVTFYLNGSTVLGSSVINNGSAILIVPSSAVASGTVSATFTPSGATSPGPVTVVQSPATGYTFISGALGWQTRLVGPNTVDGLDGLTPAATVTQSGGVTQQSTVLGTPKYDASNPMLTFFKNTSLLQSTTPQIGDLVRLKYRQAGAAVARVRNTSSVAAEAVEWGDSGIRSVTKSGLSPKPLTSLECEAAASAVLFEASRPRFEGTYTLSSPFCQGEPLAGMVLPFKNLPMNQFEVSNFAELIYEVKTTLKTLRPHEIYEYEVSFGKATDQLRVAQVLSRIYNQPDVFVPQDSASVPDYIDPKSIGTAWAPDLLFLEVSGLTSTTITLTAPSTLPSGIGIEVRSSDSGWGSTNGGNLIGRFSTQTFTVPRNSHNKAVFAKMYDTRNQWAYSEDLTQIPTSQSGAPLATVQAVNPEGALSKLTKFTPNGTFPYVDFVTTKTAANQTGCISMSVKGAPGTRFTLGAYARNSGLAVQQTTIVCNGSWIRVSLPFSWGTGVTVPIYYRISATAQVQLCRASVEYGTQNETVFCQTNGTPYGALSRHASAVRVNYPLVPPPPTATLTFGSDLSPVVELMLPQVAMDVWGFEVRAGDNATVLEHQDVSEAGVAPSLAMPQSATRDVRYYVYTYNLLGEYSAPNILEFVLPTPTITSLEIHDASKLLFWNSANCSSFQLKIDTVSNAFNNLSVNQTLTDNFFQLSDNDFFKQRWIQLTPLDELGSGSAVIAEHSYIPDPVVELNGNEVVVVLDTPDSSGNFPAVPINFQKYQSDYQNLARTNYKLNLNAS